MNTTKEKYWTVTEQDVGRELGNPDWVHWASKRISELEGKLMKAQMATIILDEMSASVTGCISEESGEVISRLLNEWEEKKKQFQ
jgi:hypothetical protein